MRKIIQIAAAYDDGDDRVFALCDDGTVWAHIEKNALVNRAEGWERLMAIPQEQSSKQPAACPHGHLDWDQCPVCCH
jgi:hypothetical protein